MARQLVKKSPLDLANAYIEPSTTYKDFSKEGAEYQATLQKKPLGYVEPGRFLGESRTAFNPGKYGVALPRQWVYKTPDDLIKAQQLDDAHRSALIDRWKAIPEDRRVGIGLEVGSELDPFDFDWESAEANPYTLEEDLDWLQNYADDHDIEIAGNVLKRYGY